MILKRIKLFLSVLILIVATFLCHQIITISVSNQINKNDSAELNHIKYGLFSVDAWKRQISTIIADEINKLYLTNSNERELKKHVEIQLDNLIDNIEKRIKVSNEGSAKGWMKQSFINTFVDMKEIKKGIPEYADSIILEMTKAQTEHNLKEMVKKRIEKYFNKTFDTQDISKVQAIITRTGSKDIEEARVKLAQSIVFNNVLVYRAAWLLIALTVILFLLPGLSRGPLRPAKYLLLSLSLIILIIAGVVTPMIDMEARISQMSFMLMDHSVHFENQILYFQSKSILDVFWIMIMHKDLEMKAVGILMVGFSVVFPVLKMISSFFYYYNIRRAQENRLIQFFVLKSGKWSMADVLVVAIFMAYIGFNGIISSQFGNLGSQGDDLVLLTTNGTSLQPGFYMFLTYSILAMFLSSFLTRKPLQTT